MNDNIDKFVNNIMNKSFVSLDDINNLKVNTGLKQFFYLNNSYKIPLSISVKSLANVEEKKKQFENAISILQKFNQENIDYILIKGPILSKYLYDNEFSKNYMDLDLFINPNDYERASKIFLDNGYNNEQLLCYDQSIIKENDLSYLLFLSKGDDNYFYNQNNGFEVKDFIRFISLEEYDIIKSHIVFMNINNINIKTFDVEMTFIISMIYLYYSSYTYKGFNQKYKIDYLLEFVLYCKKYNNIIKKRRLVNLINSLKLENITKAVSLFLSKYYKIDLFKGDNVLVYNPNKVSIIYEHSFSDLSLLIKNDCSNLSYNEYEIIRNYNNNLKYTYTINHETLSTNEIKFTLKYPRILSMISFEFVFLCDNELKKCKLTFYEENIYEFRSKMNISYVFNYYDKDFMVFIFNINNLSQYKEIYYCSFLRKVTKQFYPLMEKEEKLFIKISK